MKIFEIEHVYCCLSRALVIITIMLVSLQGIAASDAGNVQWTVSRHVWGEDLSGTLQSAGGIGGLLRTSVLDVDNGKRKGERVPAERTIHYDSNGNVILLTDGEGRESAQYVYDGFGKTLVATGPAARVNRYRFSTKPVEEESGLIYYGYRYYDPVTGRWTSRDPIGEKGGVNLYGMVGNGTSANYDVLGLLLREACQCALVTSQVDGPEPGPADLVAVGILIYGVVGSVTYIVMDALPDPGSGPLTAEERAQIEEQSRERKAYKTRCTQQVPPGLTDPCEIARWELDRNRDCLNMREAYSRKWFSDNVTHVLEIANLRKAITKLEDFLRCCEE